MFRRALLCSLNAVFEHMKAFESEAPVVRLALPYQVKVEIARFILLSPLAQMEFRAQVAASLPSQARQQEELDRPSAPLGSPGPQGRAPTASRGGGVR